jgi:HlyD family secretion protein
MAVVVPARKRDDMRLFNRLLILLVVGGTGTAAWWYFNRPEPVKVRVHTLERGRVEQTVANTRAGTVKACRRARLAPGTGGQIATIQVREGDRVKTGDLLLELWNRDLKAQLTLSERESEAAQARSRAACLNADNAQREADRQIKLSKRHLASEEAVDRAITTAQTSHADCEAAQASAQVQAARVGVAQANLEKTFLTAPFDGVVAEVSGELSEYVTPSPPGIPTPPAVDLIDDACYYISAPIDEVDAPKVRIGAEARVTLDAFGEQSFPGTVRRTAPYVLDLEKQARTLEVEVEIKQGPKEAPLLAGYSADVEIVLERRDNVLRVPTAAVRAEGGVLVFDPESGLLQAREIETGLSNWEQTQVTAGLEAGEQVVLNLDQDGVKEGALAIVDNEDDD